MDETLTAGQRLQTSRDKGRDVATKSALSVFLTVTLHNPALLLNQVPLPCFSNRIHHFCLWPGSLGMIVTSHSLPFCTMITLPSFTSSMTNTPLTFVQ